MNRKPTGPDLRGSLRSDALEYLQLRCLETVFYTDSHDSGRSTEPFIRRLRRLSQLFRDLASDDV